MPLSLSLISVNGKNPWILDFIWQVPLSILCQIFLVSTIIKEIELSMTLWPPFLGRDKIFPLKSYPYNVLPKISYNLLSINKITRELNCKATFLPDSVSFFRTWARGGWLPLPGTARDSTSLTMMLHLVEPLGRVFYLHTLLLLKKIVCCGISIWVTPIFNTWNIYFLVSPLMLMSLPYLVMCVFGQKKHRASFPSQPYKPTQHFIRIHSDVWGPSKVTNLLLSLENGGLWPSLMTILVLSGRQIQGHLHLSELLSHRRNAIQYKNCNSTKWQSPEGLV